MLVLWKRKITTLNWTNYKHSFCRDGTKTCSTINDGILHAVFSRCSHHDLVQTFMHRLWPRKVLVNSENARTTYYYQWLWLIGQQSADKMYDMLSILPTNLELSPLPHRTFVSSGWILYYGGIYFRRTGEGERVNGETKYDQEQTPCHWTTMGYYKVSLFFQTFISIGELLKRKKNSFEVNLWVQNSLLNLLSSQWDKNGIFQSFFFQDWVSLKIFSSKTLHLFCTHMFS